jgi:phytoene dehydrogenase-like protein
MSKVVVIGGGIGGLTSALLLSKNGHKVTLLEQYARVGGYATAWHREGITIEGVLHEIDDIGEGSQKYEILKKLGVTGVEYVQIPQMYRVVKNGLDFTLTHHNAQKEMIDKFPNEKSGIDKYFSTLKAISKEIEQLMQPTFTTYLKMALFPLFFKNIAKYEKTTVQNFLNECFVSEDAKFAVAANIGYYTDDPSNLSLIFFAIAQQSYYNGGGWFVKGGSQKFSDALANAIKQNGGEIITGAKVEKIITDKQKACGVTYTHKDEKFTLDCDYIMNNASPIWAINAISDKSIIQNADVWENAKISPASFVVYVVLQGAKSNNDYPYSTMVFDECENIQDTLKYVYAGFDKKPFSIANYGAIDSALANKDKRFVMLCAIDKYENWIKDENYEAKKDEAAKILIERAAKIYPDIKKDLISYEAATPLTNERYTKNPNGAIYGYAQSVNQSGRERKKFAKILPNVINASAWGEIGGGYSGAFYGGIVAAEYVK